jgi:cytochrome c
MKISSIIQAVILSACAATPLLASETRWRDCRTCHAVTAPDGTERARGGRSGPNLWGIANRPLAGDSDYRFYSDDLRLAGQRGLRWSEDNFVAYLAEPTQFLRAATGNRQAESGMHVQLRSGAGALFQYLQDLSQ